MWRTRRWRKLLNLIDGLPRNSAFVEAVANDEQAAQQLLQQQPEASAPGVRLSEWSPEREILADVVDRLGNVIQAVIAAAGTKPQRMAPAARPVTAVMRLRKQRRVEQHQRLVARVLPSRASTSGV